MNLSEVYNKKLVTAEEAVKKIKSGNKVVIGHCAGVPQVLINTMCNNKDQYEHIELFHMLTLKDAPYVNEDMEGHFRLNALFVGGNTRKAVELCNADYTPMFFHEFPKNMKDKVIDVDVAIVQVSKPDNHGYCSLGISVDYTKTATECAKIVIAEVNNKMPRTFGDSFIHINDIDCVVEVDYELPELLPGTIGEVEMKIGEYCASLIEDESTLQLGIGAIPDSVLMFLKNKKNLGIHSEMISDGVIELMEKGVINNKCKNINKGKSVVTFLMGTKKLYDYIDDNPSIEFYPVDYVNDPSIIMQNNKVVSINSCLSVDLMGQVVADSIGLKQFSGVGGQVDFVRGASMSKGGKAIIAIPSTASGGKVSRIVSYFKEGTPITTTRNDVNFIVTEYGIAELKGKSLKERGRALINIAHPYFREDLIKEWEIRFKDKF